MNIKDIAATLAILGSGTLVMTGCGKEQPATEVPAGDDAIVGSDDTDDKIIDDAPVGEAACGGADHTEEGHCAGDDGGDAEASCSGEGSCSGDAE